MNAIIRRAYTTKTLIPPNVAAATRLSGSAKDGQISQLVDFYKKLPKGAAEVAKPVGPFARYKAAYIDGENASVTPLLHLIFGVFAIGYTIDYQCHLKHHKNGNHD
ncbi:mitochondrial F1-F0 ATP synthase subunit F of fungi-domain-containing protein [Mucor mucedo]|uniref:mitochondrial F1-F0 ATP synthase subunit F of fungi-domain-containing protein n=1 Tax=Mucor mucedo TaxID=29922 RepID=UPI0022210D93|nr:mitochondrial F1-F0 ATP synthase subunit F of fungi-domain-containing protein [Mucor mucedo]KAI7875275.1 mitochondrial F1-F0 ATP synthase subunit F of fungi-domain-containing protein [Mucor mucedo]